MGGVGLRYWGIFHHFFWKISWPSPFPYLVNTWPPISGKTKACDPPLIPFKIRVDPPHGSQFFGSPSPLKPQPSPRPQLTFKNRTFPKWKVPLVLVPIVHIFLDHCTFLGNFSPTPLLCLTFLGQNVCLGEE